ncbi:hypothetical protein FHS83_000903 [Rhizomicrobium palustre]|uniref:ThuA-like domain-containing protein n=1 Tax=Rhizomicrobium palustre TaxID=189966 RepID=A0A846MWI7_9PROT|nr:hypothetical protein [Rhizomicrobium palustre]NIK87585.1 hypothetical protein [Rhizomicrobium palustre]
MEPIKVLLQTTIPVAVDDWSISRFSRLAEFLRNERDAEGRPIFEVTTRNRDPLGSPDAVLSRLDRSEFDEMWLFAVDVGNGLTTEDCEAISNFRRKGRGLLVTRDHMDLGSSVCNLGGVGKAHYFHSRNPDPDEANRKVDDLQTTYISWPNFHSGANGDFQTIEVLSPIHPVLADPTSPTGAIRFLPSHPHEGAVAAPVDEHARVIARGVSKVSGRPFNLAVAFEPGERAGPAIAQSTFHHFADYNWDTRSGAPSFVDEPPGDGMLREPQAIADTHRYVRNVALWLAQSSLLSDPPPT